MVINRQENGLPLTRFVRTIQNSRGFTLIELLIVVAIIAILAALALSQFAIFKEKAKVARCSSELRSLEKEIIAYATDKGSFPPNLAEINRDNLHDPWGRPYVYSLTLHRINTAPPCLNTDFDLYSKGSNGNTADSIVDPLSLDDIVRVDDGAFCDMAERYI